jgi:hypothetical protein
MEIILPIAFNLTLKITSGPYNGDLFPTARLQKGLILLDDGLELVEEAVGFGVPILKRGLQSIFPSDVVLSSRTTDSSLEVTANFKMDLEERIARPGSRTEKSRLIYAIKNRLADLIRRVPVLRSPLTALSNILRTTLGWETIYDHAGFSTTIQLHYSIQPQTGNIKVEVRPPDAQLSDITEVVIMNEQGGNYFDHYQDSSGLSLHGSEIGCWDEVTAKEASFISSAHKLAFALKQVNGATLYRGRELVGTRLAWSGFGYSFPPANGRFNFELNIKRLP